MRSRPRRFSAAHVLVAAIALPLFQGCSDPNQSLILYRLPYANDTDVLIWFDHVTHSPKDRLDLRGMNGSGPYAVVAAQTGIVRLLIDSYTEACCGGSCPNNYVWIEHFGGEWTKYSHLATGSVTGAAGLSKGDLVLAGQLVGYESNIGTCTDHLHFEVGVPDDPENPIQNADVVGNSGYLVGENRVPRFCGVPGQVAVAGDVHTAGPCPVVLQCIRSTESPATEGNCVDGLSGEVCVQQLHPAALGSTYVRGIDFESPMVKIELDWCATADCDPAVTTGRAIHVIVLLDDPANPNADPVQFVANCHNPKVVATVNHVDEIIIREAPNLSSENVVCGGNAVPNAYASWEICEVPPFFDL